MKRSFLYKILSYFWPVVVDSEYSKEAGKVEVCYSNGRLMLNSSQTNYSFGNLHKIFIHSLRYFGFETTSFTHPVLLLGVGGGSLVHILRENYRYEGSIVGVESDGAVLNLAQKHFSRQLGDIKLYQRDAVAFTQLSSEGYSCIFVDVFIDKEVPSPFLEPSFIKSLSQVLAPGGVIFHNVMHVSVRELLNTYTRFFHYTDHISLMDSNVVIKASDSIR